MCQEEARPDTAIPREVTATGRRRASAESRQKNRRKHAQAWYRPSPWTLFAFRPSATATKAWWHRCKRCSRWDVSAEQMSGGFCERRVVMVRGVYGESEASPVFRWVCLHAR